ncbi:MAG: energy-coupling factor ABC transporter ATP-binding protein [Coriobacteriia bacterium]|nr:energy-coupling factor ABC transporter ATP-binding protein [Coriobacteriia bacterium]
MTALLEISDLSCTFYIGAGPVFEHYNLCLDAGETLFLQGPSGCGKTTLAQIIAGIIPRSIAARVTGQVLLAGRAPGDWPLSQRVELVGMVFQRPDRQLFLPTVEDELAFGCENLCLAPAEIERRIQEVLELLDIQELRPLSVAQLSGGQLHLVAAAAVLAMHPRLLIADELFAQLDERYRLQADTALAWHTQRGGAVIAIDHGAQPAEYAQAYQRPGVRIESFDHGA